MLSTTARIEAIEFPAGSDRYPDLQPVLRYWDEKRGERFAPRRRDIDPAELKDWLPRIMIADVAYDPLDFRYRLSGTGILDVHGKELTARRPQDLDPPEYGQLIYEHYCEAVRRREPLLYLVLFDSLDRSRSYARLLLPLSEDGNKVTMLFAVDSKEQNTRALKQYFATVMAQS
jgi:hypothetical protein